MLDRHTFSAYNTYKSSTGFEMNRRATKRISMFFTEQQLEKVAAHAAAKEHKTRKEPTKPESKESPKVDTKDQKNEK